MTSNNRKPSIKLVKVTPEMAEEWLGKNTHNRNIRKSGVAAYARDMRAGNWHLTTETIKFALDGTLLDGQHRLLAIIEAGVPVEMYVATGVGSAARDAMDTGIPRPASDVLALAGHRNASSLAAAVRFCMTYQSGIESRNQSAKPTHSEILAFVEANPGFGEAVASVLYYRHTIDIPPSVMSVAWWNLVHLDPEACEAFFASIGNAATSGDGDPRSTLIKRLANARRSGERLPQTAQLSMLFRVWNAWRKGDKLHKLPIYSPGGGQVPIPEKLI